MPEDNHLDAQHHLVIKLRCDFIDRVLEVAFNEAAMELPFEELLPHFLRATKLQRKPTRTFELVWHRSDGAKVDLDLSWSMARIGYPLGDSDRIELVVKEKGYTPPPRKKQGISFKDHPWERGGRGLPPWLVWGLVIVGSVLFALLLAKWLGLLDPTPTVVQPVPEVAPATPAQEQWATPAGSEPAPVRTAAPAPAVLPATAPPPRTDGTPLPLRLHDAARVPHSRTCGEGQPCSPAHVLDGRSDTAWCVEVGALGSAVLRLGLPDGGAFDVDEVVVSNGFGKSTAHFEYNHRPMTLRVGGTPIQLVDDMSPRRHRVRAVATDGVLEIALGSETYAGGGAEACLGGLQVVGRRR